MSNLTPCNHCNLRSLREADVRNEWGLVIEVVPTRDDALREQWPEAVDVLTNGRWAATYLALTEECIC